MGKRNDEIFSICIRGVLHERWRDWFEDLEVIITADGNSLITVSVPDQAALRGILDRLWDLNYEVLDVTSGRIPAGETETNLEADHASPEHPP